MCVAFRSRVGRRLTTYGLFYSFITRRTAVAAGAQKRYEAYGAEDMPAPEVERKVFSFP